jgi:plastocyanin
MTRIVALIFALVLVGGALAGCGDDDKGGGDGGGGLYGGGNSATPTDPTVSGPEATSTPGADPVLVTINDIQYRPKNLTVHEGQKVRWVNEDSVPHTVTARSGASFDSGTMKAGIKAFYETTMRNGGKVDYFCKIHTGQTGTITIVP